jgi:hypothetical protein
LRASELLVSSFVVDDNPVSLDVVSPFDSSVVVIPVPVVAGVSVVAVVEVSVPAVVQLVLLSEERKRK